MLTTCMPAFEDPAHWLQKEAGAAGQRRSQRFQTVRPGRALAHGAGVRSGLNKPKGSVLPIQQLEATASRIPGAGRSERWKLRRGHLFLTPGDSPLGLRLPIVVAAACPAGRISLRRRAGSDGAARSALAGLRQGRRGESVPRKQAQKPKPKPKPVRTAMSIEIRDGVLCAFMPPVEKVEDYLELIAAVEATAEELQIQVHVEGYAPPYDPRVEVIKVTPDPGVIEINIQPAQSWREAVDITFGLYEDAAKVRLGANRFLVDGRHTGTGGGNHVVVGGSHAAGFAVPAPSRSAEEPRAVLAAPSVAVVFVLRHVHRPDQPGAAHRRGAA